MSTLSSYSSLKPVIKHCITLPACLLYETEYSGSDKICVIFFPFEKKIN